MLNSVFYHLPSKPSLTVFQTKRRLNIIKCIFPSVSLARIHAHEENSERTSSKVENTFLPMELPFLLFKVNLFFFSMTALDWELYAITNIEFFSVILIVNSLKTGQCNFYYALFLNLQCQRQHLFQPQVRTRIKFHPTTKDITYLCIPRDVFTPRPSDLKRVDLPTPHLLDPLPTWHFHSLYFNCQKNTFFSGNCCFPENYK